MFIFRQFHAIYQSSKHYASCIESKGVARGKENIHTTSHEVPGWEEVGGGGGVPLSYLGKFTKMDFKIMRFDAIFTLNIEVQ